MNAVVRTDKMFATDNRAGLVSVRFQSVQGEGSAAKTVYNEIQNGNVLKLGDLEAGSREIYKGSVPAKNDELKNIVLVATPELMYDERMHNLDEFINKAGVIARGYHLHTNDIFSVTKEALDGVADPAVGDVVELKAGTKLNVAAKATGLTSGSTKVGEIIDINVVGRYKYYAIEVK